MLWSTSLFRKDPAWKEMQKRWWQPFFDHYDVLYSHKFGSEWPSDHSKSFLEPLATKVFLLALWSANEYWRGRVITPRHQWIRYRRFLNQNLTFPSPRHRVLFLARAFSLSFLSSCSSNNITILVQLNILSFTEERIATAGFDLLQTGKGHFTKDVNTGVRGVIFCSSFRTR